jgi:hypothetical protein
LSNNLLQLLMPIDNFVGEQQFFGSS